MPSIAGQLIESGIAATGCIDRSDTGQLASVRAATTVAEDDEPEAADSGMAPGVRSACMASSPAVTVSTTIIRATHHEKW